MKTFEFGSWPSKRLVEVSGNQLTIRTKKKTLAVLSINQIDKVYLSYPENNAAGNLFFSINGEEPPKLTEPSNKNIFYAASQQNEINELLSNFDLEKVKTSENAMSRYKREQQETKSTQASIAQQSKINQSKVTCPNCRSVNIENLGNNKKSFSVGKAIGGGLLTGGIGTLAGFAGKKGKTDKWHCKECGNVFDR